MKKRCLFEATQISADCSRHRVSDGVDDSRDGSVYRDFSPDTARTLASFGTEVPIYLRIQSVNRRVGSMHRSLWISLLLISVICVVSAACAHGQLAVEPSLGASPKSDEKSPVDSRLEQKVTINAKRKTVSSILAELSKATNVALTAGANKLDWQVRDRKMNIFVKDVPLASLMGSIARVMKFKWSKREKDGVFAYSLYMDRKTLLDADARRGREDARVDDHLKAGRQSLLESFSDSHDNYDQNPEALKQDDPQLYVLTKFGVASALGSFFNKVPEACQAFASGQQLSFSGADLSPEAQVVFGQAAEGIRRMRELVSYATPGSAEADLFPPPQQIGDDIGKWQISINSDDFSKKRYGTSYLGDITILWPAPVEPGDLSSAGVECRLYDSSSNAGRRYGEMLVGALEQKAPVYSADLDTQISGAVVKEEITTDLGDPVTVHSDDAQLHRRVKLPVIIQNEMSERLEILSDASKLGVVSDCFGRHFPSFDSSTDEMELKDILDKLVLSYDYNWDKHGSILEFRDRHWFKKRGDQIPDAWIETWRQAVKKTGMLDLEDLADIAMLDQGQYEANIQSDEVLVVKAANAVVYRELLRLYASFVALQQGAVFSNTGLNLRSVSPDQWVLVEDLLRRDDGLVLQDPEIPLRLFATRVDESVISGKDVKPGKLAYNFRLVFDEEHKPLEWVLVVRR